MKLDVTFEGISQHDSEMHPTDGFQAKYWVESALGGFRLHVPVKIGGGLDKAEAMARRKVGELASALAERVMATEGA